MEQVITIAPDGTVSGLLHKKGQGVDLRALGGPAEIKRASEVVWNEAIQAWVVEFRAGAGRWAGFMLDQGATIAAGLGLRPDGFVFKALEWEAFGRVRGDLGVFTFDEYEDGVKAEIAVLNGLRLAGSLT